MIALLIEWLFGLSFAVVPMAQMRYADVGDWLIHDGMVSVIVADTGSWRYNFLIGLHEAVEAKLCQRAGITQEMVDQWDMTYARRRTVTIEAYRANNLAAPWLRDMYPESSGDSYLAPYHTQHVQATRIERIASWILWVNWGKYETRLDSLLEQAA